jgi:hypothetical protein
LKIAFGQFVFGGGQRAFKRGDLIRNNLSRFRFRGADRLFRRFHRQFRGPFIFSAAGHDHDRRAYDRNRNAPIFSFHTFSFHR